MEGRWSQLQGTELEAEPQFRWEDDMGGGRSKWRCGFCWATREMEKSCTPFKKIMRVQVWRDILIWLCFPENKRKHTPKKKKKRLLLTILQNLASWSHAGQGKREVAFSMHSWTLSHCFLCFRDSKKSAGKQRAAVWGWAVCETPAQGECPAGFSSSGS